MFMFKERSHYLKPTKYTLNFHWYSIGTSIMISQSSQLKVIITIQDNFIMFIRSLYWFTQRNIWEYTTNSMIYIYTKCYVSITVESSFENLKLWLYILVEVEANLACSKLLSTVIMEFWLFIELFYFQFYWKWLGWTVLINSWYKFLFSLQY